MLRSNDLIWSRSVHDYLMGEPPPAIDIMAWNADLTRMPYRMHSQYLRSLFLNNDLAEGRFEVDGRPVALPDIRVPVFVVSTERDHVAPWRSVFKLNLLTDTEVTFVLTSGGHNAGIVSEPGHPHRHFRIGTREVGEPYVDPDAWVATHMPCDGSWWPAWTKWLAARSSDLIDAPGARQRCGRIRGLRRCAGALRSFEMRFFHSGQNNGIGRGTCSCIPASERRMNTGASNGFERRNHHNHRRRRWRRS